MKNMGYPPKHCVPTNYESPRKKVGSKYLKVVGGVIQLTYRSNTPFHLVPAVEQDNWTQLSQGNNIAAAKAGR